MPILTLMLSGAARRLVLATALLGLGALSNAGWAASAAPGVPVDANFKPAERAATLMTLADPTASGLKGLKRVAISSFQVEFVTKGAASASSYEIGRQGRASTSVYITLVGLNASDFQAITDQLYNDFGRDLQASGLEVVPVDKVLAAAAYRKMAASGKPSPAETRTKDTWSTVYAPAGLGVYGIGSSSSAIALLAGFSAMSDVSTTMFGNMELAKELDASLLVVRLVVNFVDMKSSDSSWFSRSSGTATVSWKFGPSVAAGSSSVMVASANNNAMLTLGAPLLIDGAAFTEVKDTTSVAGNVGLALLSAAIGKGGSATAEEKEAVADPQRYRALVGAGVGAVREMFMQRLRAVQ